MIEQLTLKNFTNFSDLTLNLSPNINLIIGENSTGKTQLLKSLYFANKALALKDASSEELIRLFRPKSKSLKGLVGENGKVKAELICQFANGQMIHTEFSANSKNLAIEKFVSSPDVGIPNFIPVKEVLSLLQGMLNGKNIAEIINRLFDQSYLDMANKLAVKAPINPSERLDNDPRFFEIYSRLIERLGGRFDVIKLFNSVYVTFKNGSYERVKDKKSKNHGKLTFRDKRSDSADMTAEGLRKLGTLQLLLENKELNPGSSGVFLWDEPEANLNPALMKLVVQTLLELSRNGQQIVLATHDYVLLKWFDLLMDKGKGDHIRFHVLSLTQQGVNRKSADSYQLIPEHSIANTFSELYDEEIKRSLSVTG